MKSIYLSIAFAISLFVGIITPAYAQEDGSLVPESNYNGHGITVDKISFTASDVMSERVMFYNIGKKKFLNAGGTWGTRAATHTAGLAVRLEKRGKEENKYYMHSPFLGAEGEYLGYVNSSNRLRKGLYFDRSKDCSDPMTATVFTFTKVDVEEISDDIKTKYNITDEDNIYRIQLLKDDNQVTTNGYGVDYDADLVSNQSMRVHVFKSGNQNLVDIREATRVDSMEYVYWKIANMNEIENTMLTETNIYKSEPADLSFLIRAQNFNRRNIYTRDGYTPTEDRGWKYTFNDRSLYTTKFADSDFKIDGLNFNADTHGDGKYGMFYCAQIKNSEKYTVKKGERLYQTVPVSKPGWYRVDCQAFFYNGGGKENCCALLFAHSDDKADRGTAENAYVNLLPQRYMAKYDREIAVDKSGQFDLNARLSNLKAGNAPANHLEAGVAFYTNEYPNSVLVYVTDASSENPANLTFGIEATRDFTADDVVYADNFNLKYLGQSFALDDQGKLNSTGKFTNRPLVLRRDLKKGKWNAIVLPVNLTKYQVNTTFFPYPRIAEFTGFKDMYTLEFKIKSLDNISENEVVMKAGQCYIINPGYEGNTGELTIGDREGKPMNGPYYVIDRVSYDSENSATIEVVEEADAHQWPGSDCRLITKGSYEPVDVSKNAYLLYSGTLYHLTETYRSKGYCWWIEDIHQMGTNGKSHLMFNCSIMDDSNGTTDVMTLKMDGNGNILDDNDAIYNIQGQKMSNDTALPRGIYIRSGKKYVVK